MVDAEDRRHVVGEVGRWSCGSPWGSPSLREPSETEFWGRTVFSSLGKPALNRVPRGRRLRSWIGFLRNPVFPGEVLSGPLLAGSLSETIGSGNIVKRKVHSEAGTG